MNNTVESILQNKIIMIVRGVDEDKIVELAEAMYRGGVRLMECTYDASGATPDEKTAEIIATLSKHFEGRMLIGAGTVLKKNQIALTKAAGGRFIISPDTNPEIIEETKRQGLVSIPGAATPSEASTAYRAGADFVKLFPVSYLGGAAYLKAISAPLSNIRFLAVGGVKPESMQEYLKSGASGFGLGLTNEDRAAIASNAFESIENRCRALCECISE